MSVAKGLAALMVMLGHYGHIPNFWVVVTVALLVFSISSGYFTWNRYNDGFRWRSFWSRKAQRLVYPLFVIQLALGFLFVFEKRQGLLSWHTIVNLVGLNGFLNWFHIENKSPYGAGMWFLTLLIVFYAVFPLLSKLYKGKLGNIVTVGLIVCFLFLHFAVPYGHALWLTAAGFPLGITMSQQRVRLRAPTSFVLLIITSALMLGFHFWAGVSEGNSLFILALAILVILFLNEVELPKWVLHAGGWLSGLLLEIYILHPHLYLNATNAAVVNICLSMVYTIVISAALAWATVKIKSFIPSGSYG